MNMGMMADEETIAQDFLKALAAGQFMRAHAKFDNYLKRACPVVVLSDVWRQAQARVGQLVSYDEVTQLPHPEYKVMRITCDFERGSYGCRLAFRNGRITAMFMDHLVFSSK